MSTPRATACAYVALGSNLGDRRAILEDAVRELRRTRHLRVLRVSSWIETEPVGGPEHQPKFLNGALALETELSALELLRRLQELEARAGRDRAREVPNGPRRLDLDLLLYGDLALATEELALPHPRMHERSFVLEPLAEIAPDLIVPALGRRVGDLCAARAHGA